MDSENFTNSGFIPQNENQAGANVNMNNQFAAPANRLYADGERRQQNVWV